MPRQTGDTLATRVPQVNVPTLIATATADAYGIVTLSGMPAARFRVEVKTPDGSTWASRTVDGFVPHQSLVRIDVQLSRK